MSTTDKKEKVVDADNHLVQPPVYFEPDEFEDILYDLQKIYQRVQNIHSKNERRCIHFESVEDDRSEPMNDALEISDEIVSQVSKVYSSFEEIAEMILDFNQLME